MLAIGLPAAHAEGCYTCGDGSSAACKNYCRYPKDDTFEARKQCEQNGCKISGKSSCPKAAADVRICAAPLSKSQTSVAAIPWCPSTIITTG